MRRCRWRTRGRRVRTRTAAPEWIVPFLFTLVGAAYFAFQLISMRHAAQGFGL